MTRTVLNIFLMMELCVYISFKDDEGKLQGKTEPEFRMTNCEDGVEST